jgi:hypothetical protein
MKSKLLENFLKEEVSLDVLVKNIFDEMQNPLGFWGVETNYANLGSRRDDDEIKEYELKHHPNAIYKKNEKGEYQYHYSLYENCKYYQS